MKSVRRKLKQRNSVHMMVFLAEGAVPFQSQELARYTIRFREGRGRCRGLVLFLKTTFSCFFFLSLHRLLPPNTEK